MADHLTQRERHILALVGQGKTSKEIACLLQCSPGTVDNHRKSICRKLRVHSTAELIFCAIQVRALLSASGGGDCETASTRRIHHVPMTLPTRS
jgi:DNA-binding CsgD family transcriptional regulator